MNLSNVNSLNELREICKEGTTLVMTYHGSNEDPVGYINDVVIYKKDFHRYFLIEKLEENSFSGYEWDDLNSLKIPRWYNICELNSWEVHTYEELIKC